MEIIISIKIICPLILKVIIIIIIIIITVFSEVLKKSY